MNLSLEERETVFNQVAADRSLWEVFTDDPVWQRRLEKLGFVGRLAGHGEGKYYTVPDTWVSIRKPREISEAQREALRRATLASKAALERSQDDA